MIRVPMVGTVSLGGVVAIANGRCGFPWHGKPCSKPAAESIRSRLRHCLWPTLASGRRSCAVEQGNGKARRRSDADPSGGLRRGWVGRSRGRHLIGDTLSLPPEMETPACGGCLGRRCERPVQLRSTSFHGQVESAEPRGAFRLKRRAVKLRIATCPQIPAVRGGSAESRLPIVIRLSPRGAMVPCLRWNGAASHALFQLSPRVAMFPV